MITGTQEPDQVKLNTPVDLGDPATRSALRRTLVAWPVNCDELASMRRECAACLGGSAPLGSTRQVHAILGPEKTQCRTIAERRFATLNQGASLFELGVSEHVAAIRRLVSTEYPLGQHDASLVSDVVTDSSMRSASTPRKHASLLDELCPRSMAYRGGTRL